MSRRTSTQREIGLGNSLALLTWFILLHIMRYQSIVCAMNNLETKEVDK